MISRIIDATRPKAPMMVNVKRALKVRQTEMPVDVAQ